MEFIFILLIFGYLALAFKNLKLSVALIPLLLPLYLVRFQVLGVPFTLLEGFTYAVAIPVFIDIVKNYKTFKYNWTYGLLDLLFLACIIGVVIVPKETLLIDGSTIYEGQRVSLGMLKGFIFAPMLYFVSFLRVLKEKEWKEYALKGYILGASILALWGIYQAITGDYITVDFRASGPFESANYLALYVGPAFVAVFIYFWKTLKRCGKETEMIASGILMAILFMAIIFTRSYGALIGSFAGILFYALYSVSKVWKIASVVIVGFVFAISFFIHAGSDKFEKFLDFENRSSSSVRIEVWEIAVGLIREHPILGIGLGQYEPQYQLKAPQILGHPPYEWVMLHPHNLYLAFWLNTGLLGMAAFLFLIVIGLRNFMLASREKKRFLIIGAAMLIAILVHGFFDVPFWKNDLAYIFWLTLGLLL
ncbi:MAG: O-antigen ligase family protein [Patescibacteria group bacterium]